MWSRLQSLLSHEWGGWRYEFLFWPLSLISFLYRAILCIREMAYEKGVFRKRRVDCPVISVGNIVLGGSGKTPLVEYLASFLQQQGRKVGILSRGYKGEMKGGVQIVSDGNQLKLDARQAGDEPYLLGKKVPGAVVLTGKNRYELASFGKERFDLDTILMDDGFQHFRLHRDLDIVCFDQSIPLRQLRLFPRGMLREPLRGLQRADIFVETQRADSALAEAELPPLPAGSFQTFSMRYIPVELRDVPGTAHCDLDRLKGMKVFAFAGIASPGAFFKTLKEIGVVLVGTACFPDHYAYEKADCQRIVREAQSREAEFIISTEKDGVRLENLASLFTLPLWFLQIRVSFNSSEKKFLEAVRTVLK